jgi:hypothetical protein
MGKSRFILITFIVSFSILLSLSIRDVYGQEVNPPQELTGSHTILSCDMCHGEGVWHTAQKDSTVCKRCHGDQWEILTEKSMHSFLMTEGTYRSGPNEVEVSYCSTCHSPHNNDYLRIRSTNGTVKHYFFNNSLQICINCHFTGESNSSIRLMSLQSENGGSENIASFEFARKIHQNTESIKVLSPANSETAFELIDSSKDPKSQTILSTILSYLSLPVILISGIISFILILILIASRNKGLM